MSHHSFAARFPNSDLRLVFLPSTLYYPSSHQFYVDDAVNYQYTRPGTISSVPYQRSFLLPSSIQPFSRGTTSSPPSGPPLPTFPPIPSSTRPSLPRGTNSPRGQDTVTPPAAEPTAPPTAPRFLSSPRGERLWSEPPIR